MIGNEREEVMRGLEALQRTERWYRNRLKYLSLEERALEGIPHTTKEVCCPTRASGYTTQLFHYVHAEASREAACGLGDGVPVW